MNTEKVLKIIHAVNKEFSILQAPFELVEVMKFLMTRGIKNYLEIGTHYGGSFACFYPLCSGKRIFIDHPTKTTAEIHQGRAEKFKNMTNVHPIIADSHLPETVEKVRDILQGELLDFLYIDGDHTYEACKCDYELYKDLVNPQKGVIGFHDINESNQTRMYGADVHKFWVEVKGNKLSISQGLEWCGTGLLILDPYPALVCLDRCET